MPITSLHITNVGPFNEIKFEFDDQVNVFTGPNNSGKSSALSVLADTSVYPFTFPRKLLRPDQVATFQVHVAGTTGRIFEGQLPILRIVNPDSNEGYWTPERWQDHLDFLKTVGFSKFIPALRLSTDFISKGPTAADQNDPEDELRSPQKDYDRLWQSHLALFRRSRLMRQNAEDEDLKKRLGLISSNATLIGDEQVIQTIVEWDYRSYLRKQPGLRNILVKIGEVAEEITDGFVTGFYGVSEYGAGFVPEFRTIDGVLPVNTLSQGTQSVIQWLSHLLIGYAEYYDFPESLAERPGIFVVDEIDAHLHPSWQRRIIPTLTAHFPNLQIFCSTHSPLMLAGLREGQVQLLRPQLDNNVIVSRNQSDIRGWTGDEILRNVLGVTDPTDREAAEHFSELERLENMKVRSEEETEKLKSLRGTVGQSLLSGPTAVTELEEFTKLLNAMGEDHDPPENPISDDERGE